MFQETLPETLIVSGCRLAMGRCGAGRPLIYLHGCDGVSLDDPFIAPLAAHFEVTALSLPGFGDSDLPAGVRDVAEVARIVARAMTALGVHDAVLVGSSLGGWVAAETCLLDGAPVGRLVLAAPMGARFTKRPDEVEITDVFTIPTNDTPGWFIADPQAADAAFSGMRFADMADDAAVRFCRNREALTLFGWAPLLHDTTLARRLAEIRVATLVIGGGKDRILAPGYARAFAERIPHAEYVEIAAAGHYLAFEAPRVFAERIAAFADAAATADAA